MWHSLIQFLYDKYMGINSTTCLVCKNKKGLREYPCGYLTRSSFEGVYEKVFGYACQKCGDKLKRQI